jgi:hypothetical protein
MDDEVQGPDRGGLMEAYTHSQKNFDEYLTKASLSPWVPVPDPVAKRMLEIAEVGPEDVSVRRLVRYLNNATQSLTSRLIILIIPCMTHRFTLS